MVRLLSVLILVGCTTVPREITINGVNVIEHPYTACPVWTAPACATQYEWEIYWSSPEYRDHEIDHVKGLTHSKWNWNGKEYCSEVLIPGSTKYNRGDTICGKSADVR